MSDTFVHHDVSSDGAVHTLTIDKPPGNVIDMAMCAQLRPAIAAAAAAEDGKVLVVRGAGKHFSFGASVEEHLPEQAPAMLEAVGGVIRDLVGFPYPTVAGVQGACLGGGLELALACGIIIAEETAKLANPEIQLGVIAPAATALLSGRAAEDVLLTGRSLSAQEGYNFGIVNVVAPAGELDEAVATFADENFVPRSPLSLRMATKAVRGPQLPLVEARLAEAERLYLEELLPTHDGVEGIKAFMEKRAPEWLNA
jgi:cyclohexa-1,5-dienecarbonyl-CoA hydratase